MCENRNLYPAASENGINYYIICEDTTKERAFGIMAIMENDKSDKGLAENIFFTREEALQCCRWLAANQVFPVTLCDVLENLYHL